MEKFTRPESALVFVHQSSTSSAPSNPTKRSEEDQEWNGIKRMLALGYTGGLVLPTTTPSQQLTVDTSPSSSITSLASSSVLNLIHPPTQTTASSNTSTTTAAVDPFQDVIPPPAAGYPPTYGKCHIHLFSNCKDTLTQQSHPQFTTQSVTCTLLDSSILHSSNHLLDFVQNEIDTRRPHITAPMIVIVHLRDEIHENGASNPLPTDFSFISLIDDALSHLTSYNQPSEPSLSPFATSYFPASGNCHLSFILAHPHHQNHSLSSIPPSIYSLLPRQSTNLLPHEDFMYWSYVAYCHDNTRRDSPSSNATAKIMSPHPIYASVSSLFPDLGSALFISVHKFLAEIAFVIGGKSKYGA